MDTTEGGGRKDSQGLKKLPLHLLPYDAITAIANVLWYGARKYEERNWEKGMAWSDVYGGVMRHLFSWWNKEGPDPETNFSHLWHAGCGLLFLITYEIRGLGKDDRP